MSAEVVTTPAPPAGWFRGQRLGIFLRNRLAVAGALFILAAALTALWPGLVAPYDPDVQSLGNRFQGPNGLHWLGTDEFGRDWLSRVIWGTRTSMLAGVEALTIAMCIGVPLGMTAAYFKGALSSLLDRVNEALMSVPALLLAITIVAVLGPGLVNAMIGVGIAFSPRFYRIARAATHNIREETFIEASASIGCSSSRILWRHIFPNILSTIIVQAALTFGNVILAEASLSFLGLGVLPPTSSWGLMLQSAASSLYLGKHLVWGPGIMLVVIVLAFQLAGDGLRDALGAGRRDDTAVGI